MPGFQVFAGAAQVLIEAMAAADNYVIARSFYVLLHDYGVAACGHDAARHDAHARAGFGFALERYARE